MSCPYCKRIVTEGNYTVRDLQRPPRTPNLAPLSTPSIVAGPVRIGRGNYEFGANFAGLPQSGGTLGTEPGYAGPNNPRQVWPYIPPTRAGFVTYSPGSDPYYGSLSPTTFFGGTERIGIPRIDPDQYGTSRSGLGGYGHGTNVLGQLGGWSNFNGSIV